PPGGLAANALNGGLYFLTPDGGLYAWDGKSVPSSMAAGVADVGGLPAALGADVYADPQGKLVGAPAPAPLPAGVAASVSAPAGAQQRAVAFPGSCAGLVRADPAFADPATGARSARTFYLDVTEGLASPAVRSADHRAGSATSDLGVSNLDPRPTVQLA